MTSHQGEVLRALANALNARDYDGVRGLLHDELEFTDMATGTVTNGPDAFLAYARGWIGALSDMQLQPHSVVGDERHVAGEFTVVGTNDGPLPAPEGPIPATGRRLEMPFAWYAALSHDRIVCLNDYYDGASLMAQLGLMPEVAEAAAGA